MLPNCCSKLTPAHISGAACSNETPCGSCTVVCGSAARNSANAPSFLNPAVSRFLQNLGSSLAFLLRDSPHPVHSPQARLKLRTPTRSPTFQFPAHFDPTRATTPAGSWDGIMGSSAGNWPCRTWRSEWQKPAAWTRTRSSSSLISGIGLLCSWYGLLY